MSTERLSFGFNSLVPEAYKNKAEAFAKCLQHKLLSLGRIDVPSGSHRLNENQVESQIYYPGNAKQSSENFGSVETNIPDKTDDSDEEFCSHSGSENGDWTEKREPDRTKHLTSMSSEDSTVDSWSSCQDNLTDFEKLDSETEENSLASQVKGSPKLRNFNIRIKRKEFREKTWKRNPRKNHFSSTESVDSDAVKQIQNRQSEAFDPEFNSQYILLDGLEPEEDEVPHRILRESSSTSNLEKHFSRRDEKSNKLEKKVSEESTGVDTELLTPPPSPDFQKKVEKDDLKARLQFARVETKEEVDFGEVECLKDFNVDELSRSVKKINGVIVECQSCTKTEVPFNCPADFKITSVEVLHDDSSKPVQPEETKDIKEAEDEEILNTHLKMRRCSSLKTWKTPPGTPGSKKIVRFADALGLDLADVRTFLDEIPRVPSSAYEDLHFDVPKPESIVPPLSSATLIPLFQQPGNNLDFLEKVGNQKICLESTIISPDGVLTVTGFIRVQNISFHKSVHVRYSLNNWETFSDLQATYVPNSCDGFSDRFSFVLYGHTLKIGQKLEFALRLECSGAQYWDNNGGINYILNCLPLQASSSSFFPSLCSNQGDPWFDFY